jgi:hypothetical protein
VEGREKRREVCLHEPAGAYLEDMGVSPNLSITMPV